MRPSQRQFDQLRDVEITTDISLYAEGSCLIKCGHTHIHCTASVSTNLPVWRRGSGKGWITAEYGMLPRATDTRMRREATVGKQGGRTQEIQRLIGRSLRAVVDLKALGEIQIVVDCDVIRANGGTRTASITGGFVALYKAIEWMKAREMIEADLIIEPVAAVSCGLYKGEAILDLDYDEDVAAQADANFVLTGSEKIIEIQGTAEQAPFTRDQFNTLLDLAEKGVAELMAVQQKALDLTRWPQR